jgi:hypothetical protein
MTPEDRDLMLDLCKRIARATEPRKLASLIRELSEVIESKVSELRVHNGLPDPIHAPKAKRKSASSD